MRPIDADAFKAYIMDGIADHDDIPPLQFSIVEAAAKGFLLDIDEQPTLSPDDVRGVGEWLPAETELGFSCSVCGKLLDEYVHGGEWVSLAKMPNYCPNCGAKMEVE